MPRRIGDGSHLKLRVEAWKGGPRLDAIDFDLGDRYELMHGPWRDGLTVDLAFRVTENRWKG